jgi:hypothetical protein
MNERQEEQGMPCPACGGADKLRWPALRIGWFECAYCYGIGEVTKERFNAWQARSAKFAAPAAEERAS